MFFLFLPPNNLITHCKMNRKIVLLVGFMAFISMLPSLAQTKVKDTPQWLPKLHGTVRTKYEYQPNTNEPHRFQVRNARFSLSGKIIPEVAYKLQIDLSDRGKQRMLDAYTKLTPFKGFDLTIGQMRVPFTIDAHRSPHLQYFANRSFIAKQVGSVRDVGATVKYQLNMPFPAIIEAGLFNGTGLDREAQEQWHSSLSYTLKGRFFFNSKSNITLGMQSTSPGVARMFLYNIGGYYNFGALHLETEYLYKHYANNAFNNVNAYNTMLCYDIPLRKIFKKLSLLLRYDYMDDHSNALAWQIENQKLVLNHNERSRITAGVTFSIDKPFIADIRLNYENYAYRSGSKCIVPSEQDKFVIEFMTHF